YASSIFPNNGPDFIKLHLKCSIETNKDRTFILKEHDFYPTNRYFSVPFLDNHNRFGKAVQIPMPLCCPNYKTNILDYCLYLVCNHLWDLEIAIWNALIRKYKKLPSERHDPRDDDYKVVSIVEFSKGDMPLLNFEFKVYSLRSHCWEKN
ncbi:hypothetical protein CFP56_004483, partial [Quercus suber]